MGSVKPFNEASWGESMKNYADSKNTLSWEQADVKPHYETSYTKSRKEREFDPILMRYRKEERENDVQKRERAFQALRLNEAKDKQLCFEQKYDIINHESYLPPEFHEASKQAGMMREVTKKAPDSK
jgi:hypothetical protein